MSLEARLAAWAAAVGTDVKALTASFGQYVQKGQTGTVGNVYVAPTGSNSNDGLSASTPFLTFQKAFDYLAAQGPILQGVWYVNAAAGTYPGVINHTLKTRSVERVVVRGPAASGGVPTAIINGAGGGNYDHGLRAAGNGVVVEFRDLKFINYNGDPAGNTRIACVGEAEANVMFTNVHVTGATWCGAYAFNTVRAYLDGGIYDGCRIGFSSNTSQTTVRLGATFKNCSQYGVHWSRGSQGHVDDAIFLDNTVALYLGESSRADCVANDFKRNGTAIQAVTGGVFSDQGNIFNAGTVDANTTDYDHRAFSGSALDLMEFTSEVRVGSYSTAQTRTGSTTEVSICTPYTIPANRLKGGDKTVRVAARGVFAGVTAGTAIKVLIGANALSLAVPTTVAGGTSWEAEVTLSRTSGAWRSWGRLSVSPNQYRAGTVSGAFVEGSAQTVEVRAALANAADSVTLYRADVYITG